MTDLVIAVTVETIVVTLVVGTLVWVQILKLRRLRTEVSEWNARAEQAETQLAGCSVAALGYTDDSAKCGDYGWSQSYEDVLRLRLEVERLREANGVN